MLNYSDKVRCYACNGVFSRGETLIVENQRGRFRVCRSCYEQYSKRRLNDDYKDATENILKYGVREIDAYELIKKKEKFIKAIKEGKYGA